MHSVSLLGVCRVIAGRVCLKLLFSRWRRGASQELLPPTMGRPHTGAFTRNASAPRSSYACPSRTGSRSKCLWPRRKKPQTAATREKNTVRLRGLVPQGWAEWAQQPASTAGGNVGCGQFKPDWTWSKCKVQSVQRWDKKEREVNRLESVVCGAAIDEWRHSAAGQWRAGSLRCSERPLCCLPTGCRS